LAGLILWVTVEVERDINGSRTEPRLVLVSISCYFT